MPWIGAVVGGVAALAGGAISKSGAESAADKTAAAADRSAQVQKEMYETTRNDLMPFTKIGYGAADRLASLFGLPTSGMSYGQPAPAPAPSGGGYAPAAPAAGAAPGASWYDPGQRGTVGPWNLPPGYRWQEPSTTPGGESGDVTLPGFLYAPDGSIAGSGSTFRDAMIQSGIEPVMQWAPTQEALPQAAPVSAPQMPWGTAGGPGALPGAGSSVSPYAIPNDGQFDMSIEALRKTPGYEFTLAEGQRAVDRSAAARGNLLSGRTMREGTRYATGLADTTYQTQEKVFGNNVNRAIGLNELYYKTNINPLFDLAKMGANTGAQVGQIGSSTANATSQALTSAGNTGAAATMAGTNAITNGLYSTANAGIYALGRDSGTFLTDTQKAQRAGFSINGARV